MIGSESSAVAMSCTRLTTGQPYLIRLQCLRVRPRAPAIWDGDDGNGRSPPPNNDQNVLTVSHLHNNDDINQLDKLLEITRRRFSCK
ncbi:hypothetical protein KCP70_21530 [Salmonella enterica subsp. enterica]|nr:hypothetical protein KCP70_21530 [Salmonella enterica subsp. enterica]